MLNCSDNHTKTIPNNIKKEVAIVDSSKPNLETLCKKISSFEGFEEFRDFWFPISNENPPKTFLGLGLVVSSKQKNV